MKKNLLLSLIAVVFFVSGYSQTNKGNKNKITAKSEVKATSNPKKVVTHKEQPTKETIALRKSHANFLKNNPFQKTIFLSEDKRKAAGLPPNKYYEQEWLSSINPVLGKPTTENLTIIRENLQKARALALANRLPGDASDNLWVERGPNNVGGRTRAIIFDPSDATGKTVIAGGASGGLWKNTDITLAATSWTKMSLPEHLNVQNITVDPNSSSTWYVGTGESYTSGDANGNGIWKTTDSGANWTRVFGGGTIASTQQTVFNLLVISPSAAGVIRGYTTIEASFGPGITSTFSAPIELVNDGTAPTEDACTALTAGSMTGKIALIRRGTCTFESKVVQAETAGAIGVIIMNNVAGAGPLGMADSGLGAGIPSVSVSKEDGDLLVANLTNLTGTFQPTPVGAFSGNSVSGIQFVNKVAIKNNGGVSEIYAAVGDGINGGSYLNAATYGLYKSVNGGSTWTKLTLPVSASGNQTCPNDVEIAFGGKIWVSSTNSKTFGDGGGKVFVSTDNGATFTLKHTVVGNAGGARIEIEASNTTADKIYVLAELDQAAPATPTIEVQILRTTDGFTTAPTVLTLPSDTDTRSATYGFTGAQAFYNLTIESDPTNDAIVLVSGLNIHKSANSGGTWTQISNWSAGNLVHSDQHAITFKPGTPNTALFGCDGGVYYCASLTAATSTSATIPERNNGFNVTQFVGVAVMPLGVAGVTGDFFVAGAQDNGSNAFPSTLSATTGATAGVNGSSETQGGDGGIPLYAQDSDKYYVTNYVYNDNMNSRGLNGATIKTLSDATTSRGQFYPAVVLDSANDIVYSDFTDGATRTYVIRRYANVKATGTLTRTNLTNALLTSYPTALATGKVTGTTLYAGTANGKLLKIVSASTTAGTWTDISGSGFVGTVSDVEFGTNDSQIFVTMSNYGVVSIWYTPNAGTNWYSIEGNLPDMPVKCILQNPLNTSEIMIGTELGVWYANTFSPTATATQALVWNQSNNGMSNVKVTDMDIQPNSPTAPTAYKVYAATYGRGVFSGTLTTPPLSTNTVDNSKGAKVYPNPSNGQFNLRIENFTGKVNIQLVDINGRVVYNVNENNFNTEKSISTNSLQAGIYILNVKGDDLNYTEKVIVN